MLNVILPGTLMVVKDNVNYGKGFWAHSFTHKAVWANPPYLFLGYYDAYNNGGKYLMFVTADGVICWMLEGWLRKC